MLWLRALSYGLPSGLAGYAVASHGFLLLGLTLPVWLFPVAVALGACVGIALALRKPASDAPLQADLPGWLERSAPILAGIVIAFAIAMVTHGALATSDRSWDGLVSWSLKAKHLVPPTSLDQPFFQDDQIFSFGIQYPPLQSLCQGALMAFFGENGSRVLFPVLYLGAIASVYTAVADAGRSRGAASLTALAFAVTPMWLNTGAGSVDSGYAELFLGYALILIAAGVLLESAYLLGLGLLLLPMIKPEGAVYGLATCAITGFLGRRLHRTGAASFAAGLALSLPLLSTSQGFEPLFVAALLVGLVAFQEIVLRTRHRTQLAVGTGILASAVAILFVFESSLRASQNVIVRHHVVSLLDLGDRLRFLPRLLQGYVEAIGALNQVGLGLILFIGLLLAPRRIHGRVPSRPLATLVGAGLLIACIAMLLSQDQDLDHAFDSRFDRLTLHWIGPAWILIGAWLLRRREESIAG